MGRRDPTRQPGKGRCWVSHQVVPLPLSHRAGLVPGLYIGLILGQEGWEHWMGM